MIYQNGAEQQPEDDGRGWSAELSTLKPRLCKYRQVGSHEVAAEPQLLVLTGHLDQLPDHHVFLIECTTCSLQGDIYTLTALPAHVHSRFEPTFETCESTDSCPPYDNLKGHQQLLEGLYTELGRHGEKQQLPSLI